MKITAIIPVALSDTRDVNSRVASKIRDSQCYLGSSSHSKRKHKFKKVDD